LTSATTRAQWLTLVAALLGWMFDGFEMGIFSLVGRTAVQDLLDTTDEARVGLWFGGIMAGFLVGAATGGVLFGWLGDRIGRVRAMTLSILTYALFTGLGGFVAEAWQIGIVRFIAALGMGGEWSLGVALVMEVWPNRSRAFMAGLIGAAANVGFVLVGVVGLLLAHLLASAEGWLLAVGLPGDLVETLVAHRGWRLLMICGAAPAVLTFLIRLFVPESEKWKHEEARGGTSHWASRDLSVVLIAVTGPAMMVAAWLAKESPPMLKIAKFSGLTTLQLAWIATVLGILIAVLGYIYPVWRYLSRVTATTAGVSLQGTLPRMLLAACLSGVALLGTWGSTQWAPSWADQIQSQTAAGMAGAREYTLIWLSLGAVAGTIAAALVGDWLGRRVTYCILCIISIVSVLAFYQPWTRDAAYGAGFFVRAFVLGACTASFYGWLPLYLPELFRTAVRATGQGFGYNFGRILAAVGTVQTGYLMEQFKGGVQVGSIELVGGYPAACSVMSLIYVLGMVLIWLAPETHGRPLPE
jgi:MFS family permease